MSETSHEKHSNAEADHAAQQRDMAEVEEELDARSDGEGLAAEAGSGEETGLAEG